MGENNSNGVFITDVTRQYDSKMKRYSLTSTPAGRIVAEIHMDQVLIILMCDKLRHFSDVCIGSSVTGHDVCQDKTIMELCFRYGDYKCFNGIDSKHVLPKGFQKVTFFYWLV